MKEADIFNILNNYKDSAILDFLYRIEKKYKYVSLAEKVAIISYSLITSENIIIHLNDEYYNKYYKEALENEG